jgi:hypothetical protein
MAQSAALAIPLGHVAARDFDTYIGLIRHNATYT